MATEQIQEPVSITGTVARAVGATDRGDEVMRRLSRELEHGGGGADDSRLADAASWALEKATDALGSAARYLRAQAARAVAKPVRDDPVRSVLIAAGVGALLMLLLSMSAKSGARAVERRVRG